MKTCHICLSNNIGIEYEGIIRDGGLGHYTSEPVTMYRCNDCRTIWHDVVKDTGKYYESTEYRLSLENSSEEGDFYRLHDKETYDKFTYTGTEIFRNKIVADIGCGCGSFLDFLSGVATECVAIEPSQKYRNILSRKGYATYAYASNAKKDYENRVDVVTSFDVIEHVERPDVFLNEVYSLLAPNGIAIIGTPTETPVMRNLLKDIYDRELLFSTQHLWIFNSLSLQILAKRQGIPAEQCTIGYYQRYGLGNMMGWLCKKEPGHDIKEEYISNTMNSVWKNELERQGLSDYIVVYIRK